MLKNISSFGSKLTKAEQKTIMAGYDSSCSSCCITDDDCMPPDTEAPDDGSYSYCSGGRCVTEYL